MIIKHDTTVKYVRTLDMCNVIDNYRSAQRLSITKPHTFVILWHVFSEFEITHGTMVIRNLRRWGRSLKNWAGYDN